ncbi:hypothetical protein AB0L75_16265 [Streptomyces sp. NPDC052101]|uniref:hypothetical protein n=1 Tax=Streptomyces sp. NPDC052101 TaxID=3155763 RepID=UPI0034152240
MSADLFKKAIQTAEEETKKAWEGFQKHLVDKYEGKMGEHGTKLGEVLAQVMVRSDVPVDLRVQTQKLHPEVEKESKELSDFLKAAER